MLRFDGDGVRAVCARDGGGVSVGGDGFLKWKVFRQACNCASVVRDFNKTERQRTYDKDEVG